MWGVANWLRQRQVDDLNACFRQQHRLLDRRRLVWGFSQHGSGDDPRTQHEVAKIHSLLNEASVEQN